jgi:cell division protein ZapA
MSNETQNSIKNFLSRVITADGTPQPKNRVRVQIAGEEFTIVAAESEDYIRRVAAMVDGKITSIIEGARVNLSDAAVLAACNLADEQIKVSETSENLRAQIKAYADEMSRLRTELADARRDARRGQ